MITTSYSYVCATFASFCCAATLFADREHRQRAVTMRYGAHQHLGSARFRSVPNDRVACDHVARVEHALAVRAMLTMKDDRPRKVPPVPSRLFRSRHNGGRHAPAPRTARRGAQRWLDTIHRAHPLGKAHVLGAVCAPLLPR